jgi:hypothetical protein
VELAAVSRVIYFVLQQSYELASQHSSYLLLTRPGNPIPILLSTILAIAPMMQGGQQVDVQLHTHTVDSVVEFLSQAASYYKVQGMSRDDIRFANEQFSFMRNISKSTSGAVNAMSSFVSVVGLLVFGYDPFDAKIQRFASSMIEVMARTTEYSKHESSFRGDRDTMLEIIRLHQQATELGRNMMMSKIPPWSPEIILSL